MDRAAVVEALKRNRTIDITTVGAKSGQPRRIETWAWLDGETVYLTGAPGRRDWYANLRANSDFTLHLKGGARLDVAVRARPIEDEQERRSVFERLRPAQVDIWAAGGPLVEVEFS